MSEASGLEAIEPWLDAVLQRLKPGERRALSARIGRMLRQRNAERIRDNSDPDGNPMPARKRKLDQRGRIRKRKSRMFPKIALARNLKVRTSPDEVELTFTGRTAQTAAVHHFGLEDAVDRRNPNSIRTRYPARRLLGIPAADRDAILDELITWLDLKDGQA
jgi:phage virion morphogenesis protein